jgi:hypothetical protein
MSIFNLSQYRQMLSFAKDSGYRFIDFASVDKLGSLTAREGSCCILRHDVDADISAALTMAKVEHDLGITATYFLMFRSPLYNLMGRQSIYLVEQILALGHAIGLHYDQGFDEQRGWATEQTAEGIKEEAHWLECQYNSPVSAVSFHQPGPAVLQGKVTTGDLINTYDHTKLSDFDYFSDSNRKFSLPQSTDVDTNRVIADYAPRNLQLLIHPMWWVYDNLTTEAVWNRAIHSNLVIMQRQLLDTERAYGSERQFQIVTIKAN